MTAIEIEQLLLALLQAAPQILALYKSVTSGGTVTAAQVQAVITQYGIDRAVFVAAIANAESRIPARMPVAAS